MSEHQGLREIKIGIIAMLFVGLFECELIEYLKSYVLFPGTNIIWLPFWHLDKFNFWLFDLIFGKVTHSG